MWSMCEQGMFSAVLDLDDPDTLVVRTRARADADALVMWLRNRSVEAKVVTKALSDYPWRVFVPRQEYALFAYEQVMAISYGNFKARIHDVNEHRAKVYGNVWYDLLRVEDEDRPPAPPAAKKRKGKRGNKSGSLSRRSRSIMELTEDEWLRMTEEPA